MRSRGNKGGTYRDALQRRLEKKELGEGGGKNNNFQKGPGQWTSESWDAAGKRGNRPDHSFGAGKPSFVGGGTKKGRNVFGGGGGSSKARAAADFMPQGVKSNNMKALRNQALARRLDKKGK